MISFIFPIYDYGTLVNSISIFLEIAGFILTIGVVKKIVQGDFVSSFEEPKKTVSNPNAESYYVGIGLVIAGLIGQFVAQGIRGGW